MVGHNTCFLYEEGLLTHQETQDDENYRMYPHAYRTKQDKTKTIVYTSRINLKEHVLREHCFQNSSNVFEKENDFST